MKVMKVLSMTTKDARRAGFHLTLGAVQCMGMLWIAALLIGSLISATDDCDRGRFDRCGMKVATDAKTGKQYLITSGGGIIERAKQ